MEDRQHWQDLLIALLGAWLIASSWILDFSAPVAESAAGAPATADFVLSGLVALGLGGIALMAYRKWEEWLAIALGLWLVASPWVLHFASVPNARWNALFNGLLIVVAAGWNLMEERQAGHA